MKNQNEPVVPPEPIDEFGRPDHEGIRDRSLVRNCTRDTHFTPEDIFSG